MRVPLSGVPVPTVPVPKPGPVPLPVQPREPQRRRKWFGWLVLVAAIGVGAALWLNFRSQPDTGGADHQLHVGDPLVAAVRAVGDFRLENFAHQN